MNERREEHLREKMEIRQEKIPNVHALAPSLLPKDEKASTFVFF